MFNQKYTVYPCLIYGKNGVFDTLAREGFYTRHKNAYEARILNREHGNTSHGVLTSTLAQGSSDVVLTGVSHLSEKVRTIMLIRGFIECSSQTS